MSDETAAEEQFIDFECPCCQEQVSFPASAAGSLQECFNCTGAIIVPESGDKGHLIPLPAKTARLTLRKFNGEDWKDLVQLFSNDDFFTAAPFKLEGEEQIARWLEQDGVVKLTSQGVPFILAVQLNEKAGVIGCVSLHFSDVTRLQANLYVAIHPEFQRQGFGVEAFTGMLDFCFRGLSLHRVQGFCESQNTAASGLLARSGMRREGEFIKDHKVGDQWASTLAFAMLREEFKPSPAS